MVAEQIEDIKGLTSKLFLGENFDAFLVREVQIVTYNSFTIDGHIRKSFYTKEELEENPLEDFSTWKRLRPMCFSLIKGKKLPSSFHIEFQLAQKGVERFLMQNSSSLTLENVNGLYLQIRYEEGILSYVTGCSLNLFTLDKGLEHAWDEAVQKFIRAL